MKTIGLKNKKQLKEVAIEKGLFANLEKEMELILASTDPREVFRGIFLMENGKVVLEIIAEDQPEDDEIRTEFLPESEFWNKTGLDREDWINHDDHLVNLWNKAVEKLSEDTLTLKISLS